MPNLETRLGSNGVRYIYAGPLKFAIIIPSRRRSYDVIYNPLHPLANIFVHESEVEKYQSVAESSGFRPGALLPHNCQGITRIMDYMLDTVYSEPDVSFAFRTDDDMSNFTYNWTSGPMRKITDGVEIAAIIAQTGQLAVDAGVSLFGYNLSPTPTGRKAFEPFKLRTWFCGVNLGIVGNTLRTDPNLTLVDDLDLSLAALAQSGLVICDQRYHVNTHTRGQGKDKGGMAGVRTSDRHLKEMQYLSQKWGADVIRVENEYTDAGLARLTVRIPH